MHALTQIRTTGLSRPEIDATTHLLGKARTRIDAVLCTLAREASKADPDLDMGELVRRQTGVSGRDAKKLVKVAQQLQQLPEVADRLAEGDITLDKARLLADAAQKIGSDSVNNDLELLKLAEEEPADSFGRKVRNHVNRRLSQTGVDPLECQRKMREAKLWTERETGLGVLLAKLPADQFARIRQRADRLYLEELRRDSTNNHDTDQIRTPAQRMADVISALLTGDPHQGDKHSAATQNGAKPSTQLVITATLGVLDGTDPDGLGEIIGAGAVPRRYLQTLSDDTLVAGMLYDRKGRILWLGRNQRLGNAAQRLAVAVRDGGCFECGAPMHQCELHHIQPWRKGGPTDIDNLVAVCPTHHKWLETQNLQVRRTNGRWQVLSRDGPQR